LANYLLLLFLLATLSVLSFSFTAPTNQRVFDEAGLLENNQTVLLEKIIFDWETKTKHQREISTKKRKKERENCR
jgi:uncharacterized membrane protein YgcG